MGNPVFAQDELITNINDLPKLSEVTQPQSREGGNSSYAVEGKKIVILYNQKGDNNIKDLELRKKDFTAGESLSGEIDVLKTDPSSDADQLIEEIGQNDNVAAVDYDDVATILEVPNDKHYELQDYYPMVNADKTWNIAGENGVQVAVLDTGLRTTHEDIQNRFLLAGKSFYTAEMQDVEGHGTEVSGVIAAVANNEVGIAGVSGISPVSIVPYQVLGPDGSGDTSLIAQALNIVAELPEQKVVNMSLGVPGNNKVLKAAVDRAVNAGKIIVAASGNDGEERLYYPAAYDNVIAVGAVNSEYKRCTSEDWGEGNGSSYGEGINYVAPGDMIASLDAEGDTNYRYSAGTSLSTPVVTAAVAQILTINPNLNFDQIKEILNKTSQDLGEPGYDLEYGYGLINMEAALNEVDNMINNPVVSLSSETLGLRVGESAQLGYSTTSDSNFHWESSNPDIASVSDGTVTAKSNGRAVISIISKADPNIKADCQVLVNKATVTISAHAQNIGWMPAVDESTIAGTTGKNLNLEAFRLMTDDPDLSIISTVHVQNVGDMVPVGESSDAGTVGQNNGIEALKLDLTGANVPYYDLYYRVHIENEGWTPYAKSGEWVGTKGFNEQIEAIELVLPVSGNLPPAVNTDVNWTFKQQ